MKRLNIKNRIALTLIVLTLIINSFVGVYAVKLRPGNTLANGRFKLDYLDFFSSGIDFLNITEDDGNITSTPIMGMLSAADSRDSYLAENITEINLVTVRNNLTVSSAYFEPFDEFGDLMMFYFMDLDNVINNEAYYISVTYLDENDAEVTENLNYVQPWVSNVSTNSMTVEPSDEDVSLVNLTVANGKNIGDVNNDKYTNSTDASMALDIFKNGNSTLEQQMLADVNKDGFVNSTDASIMLDMFKNN